MSIVLTIACVFFLAGLLVAEYRKSLPLVFATKPTASACFVLVPLTGAAVIAGPFWGWVVAGLVLGLVGDVFLMIPGRRTFLAGLVAFLLGHGAYVVACLLLVGAGAWLHPWSLLPLLAAVAAGRYLWPHLGKMRGPVLAYVVVITLMVVAAIAVLRVGTLPDTAHRWTLLLGAVLFFASDIAVARNRFVSAGFVNRAWGLPAYYAGQLLFAWSAISWL